MSAFIGLTSRPEKKIRDKSLKILQRWLSGKADIAPKDMAKIWCVPPPFSQIDRC